MVNSGSKGSVLLILQQMMYLLGEQVIDNKRVPLGFPIVPYLIIQI